MLTLLRLLVYVQFSICRFIFIGADCFLVLSTIHQENSPGAHNSYNHAKISNAKQRVNPTVHLPHHSSVVKYVLSTLKFFLCLYYIIMP